MKVLRSMGQELLQIDKDKYLRFIRPFQEEPKKGEDPRFTEASKLSNKCESTLCKIVLENKLCLEIGEKRKGKSKEKSPLRKSCEDDGRDKRSVGRRNNKFHRDASACIPIVKTSARRRNTPRGINRYQDIGISSGHAACKPLRFFMALFQHTPDQRGFSPVQREASRILPARHLESNIYYRHFFLLPSAISSMRFLTRFNLWQAKILG